MSVLNNPLIPLSFPLSLSLLSLSPWQTLYPVITRFPRLWPHCLGRPSSSQMETSTSQTLAPPPPEPELTNRNIISAAAGLCTIFRRSDTILRKLLSMAGPLSCYLYSLGIFTDQDAVLRFNCSCSLKIVAERKVSRRVVSV